MKPIVRSTSIAISVAAFLAGCSARMHGADEDIPARPALGALIERVGRPLTANSVLGPLAPGDVIERRKEVYNRAAPADWPRFAADIQLEVGLYDGLDGTCGNQWLADRRAEPSSRYQAIAGALADDRLWIDGTATVCKRFMAVELAALASPASAPGDCGGRTPDEDAVDVFRSLLVRGETEGVDDGVARDDRVHSTVDFPFLAPP